MDCCFAVEGQSGRRKKEGCTLRRKRDSKRILVAIRLRETRVPIPNTRVKAEPADGTALETVWESRWLPE